MFLWAFFVFPWDQLAEKLQESFSKRLSLLFRTYVVSILFLTVLTTQDKEVKNLLKFSFAFSPNLHYWFFTITKDSIYKMYVITKFSNGNSYKKDRDSMNKQTKLFKAMSYIQHKTRPVSTDHPYLWFLSFIFSYDSTQSKTIN